MLTNLPPFHFGSSLSTEQSSFRCPAVVFITWRGGGVVRAGHWERGRGCGGGSLGEREGL